MRKTTLLLAVLMTFALLPQLGSAAAPGPGDPIVGTGTVHGGLYPYDFWFADPAIGSFTEISLATGHKVTFAGIFHDVAEPNNPGWMATQIKLEEAWTAKATPFSNLEFKEAVPDDGTADALYIAEGGRDADLVVWANALDGWLATPGDRSLIIAPLQEMNGDWVPYGMDPVNFQRAYVHIKDTIEGIVHPSRLDKIRWAFAPNGWSKPPWSLAHYYPGDDVVDVLAISAYNFGATPDNVWQTPAQAIQPWVDELRAMSPGSADKPYLLSQTGSVTAGGPKSQWIRDVFTFVEDDPNLVGLVYFNITNGGHPDWDWRFWPTGNPNFGYAGWREAVQRPTTSYQWPLINWFQSGDLPFDQYPPDPGACPGGNTCDEIALVNPGSQVSLYEEIISGATVHQYWFGLPGDVPLMGDWDCDGTATPGMYRPSDGYAYLTNTLPPDGGAGVGDPALTFFYGIAGDIPIVGDWDNNGCDTLGIYRNGRVYIKNTLGTGFADFDFFYGVSGDRPFTGDFNGNGVDTVGLYRESTGFVYFRNTLDFGTADFEFFYGAPSDRILAGDWNGDGVDTVAVYRPSDGRVYFRMTNTQGFADYELDVGTGFIAANWAGD